MNENSVFVIPYILKLNSFLLICTFRKIMVDICFDEDRNLDDKDIIEYTASSPIRQYKLMKDFLKFARDIYPKVLFEYLDSGMT